MAEYAARVTKFERSVGEFEFHMKFATTVNVPPSIVVGSRLRCLMRFKRVSEKVVVVAVRKCSGLLVSE